MYSLPPGLLLLVLLCLAVQPERASALGLFFRTSWAHEVSQATLDAWFGLIELGRAQGPSSPYYVEFLVLQVCLSVEGKKIAEEKENS